MIEFVLIVCLMAQPDKCERIYLAQEAPANLMVCLLDGQKQAAKWLQDHPGYVIRRWSCGEPRA